MPLYEQKLTYFDENKLHNDLLAYKREYEPVNNYLHFALIALFFAYKYLAFTQSRTLRSG